MMLPAQEIIDLARRGDLGAIISAAQFVTGNMNARRRTKVFMAEDVGTLHLAYSLVRACHNHNLVPPYELVEMFRLILRQDREPRGARGPHIERAVAYAMEHPELNNAEIGTLFNLHRSTVSKHLKRLKRDR